MNEAGGWTHPFNTEGEGLLRGGPVLAVAPGAKEELMRIAQL